MSTALAKFTALTVKYRSSCQTLLAQFCGPFVLFRSCRSVVSIVYTLFLHGSHDRQGRDNMSTCADPNTYIAQTAGAHTAPTMVLRLAIMSSLESRGLQHSHASGYRHPWQRGLGEVLRVFRFLTRGPGRSRSSPHLLSDVPGCEQLVCIWRKTLLCLSLSDSTMDARKSGKLNIWISGPGYMDIRISGCPPAAGSEPRETGAVRSARAGFVAMGDRLDVHVRVFSYALFCSDSDSWGSRARLGLGFGFGFGFPVLVGSTGRQLARSCERQY